LLLVVASIAVGEVESRAEELRCNHVEVTRDLDVSSYRFARRVAAQYLGAPLGVENFAVAWITLPNLGGQRQLRYRIYNPRSCIGRAETTAGVVGDVNYVNHGGQLPASWVRNVRVPEHGYLVASTRGSAGVQPHLAILRLDPANLSVTETPLPTDSYCTFSHCGYRFPDGLFPDMAVSHPRRSLTKLVSECRIRARPWPQPPQWYCDSGHRALVVFAGSPLWKEQVEGDVELPGPRLPSSFWAGRTVEFRLLRPDGTVVKAGKIAGVSDGARDQIVYPEVVWNPDRDRWVVMWEEKQFKGTHHEWVRRSATVDFNGKVVVTPLRQFCWDGSAPTKPARPTAAASGSGREAEPFFDGLCELFNLSYNSREELNPGGQILGFSYDWYRCPAVDPPENCQQLEVEDPLQWFEGDGTKMVKGLNDKFLNLPGDLEFMNDRHANIEPMRRLMIHDDGNGDPLDDQPFGHVTVKIDEYIDPILGELCQPRFAYFVTDFRSRFEDVGSNWVGSYFLSNGPELCVMGDFAAMAISTSAEAAGALYTQRDEQTGEWVLYFSSLLFQ
jgi:hypothetical protein